MKREKIYSICKENKNIMLCEKIAKGKAYEQWLGNGCAAYPLGNMPIFDKDTIYTLLGITDDKKNGWNVHVQDISVDDLFADNLPEDIPLRKFPYTFDGNVTFVTDHSCDKNNVLPDVTIFIDNTFLSPIADEDCVDFYCRRWNNGYAVICRTGLLLRAVILPKIYRDNSNAVQNLLDWMRTVVAEISREIAGDTK